MEPKKLLVKYLSLTYGERLASYEKNMEGFDINKHKLQSITGRETEWQECYMMIRSIMEDVDIKDHLWRYVDKETELMTRPLVIGDEEFIMWDEPEPQVSLNYNEGKLRPSLILRDMQKSFEKILDVREYGCRKYDRLNWAVSKGTGDAEKFLADNLDSIHRHLLEHESGKEVDEESGCLHLAQVAIRCMFAIEYMTEEGRGDE